jgi:hypothetical protein
MPNKNPAQGRVIAKVVLLVGNTLGLILMVGCMDLAQPTLGLHKSQK